MTRLRVGGSIGVRVAVSVSVAVWLELLQMIGVVICKYKARSCCIELIMRLTLRLEVVGPVLG